MERVLQILIVFVLLMLVIRYSVYSREKKFREYYFVRQIALPPPDSAYWRLLSASLLPGGKGSEATDEENQLLMKGGGAWQGTENVERAGDGVAGTVAIFDEASGERIAFIALEESVDALLFDPAGRLLFCCSSAGGLSIIRQVGRESYKVVQHLVIPVECGDMAFDIKTGRLYLQSGKRVLLYERE